MKNKKGFTLVELMAVIVVLAIVIAIAIPTYNKIKSIIDVKNYENKKELIKVAASKFAEDTNITAIFVKELVENGYLEADDEDGNVYGLGRENINCYVILTEQKNGMFYSEFINENYMEENKECNYNIPNELTNGFKIVMYEQEETDGKETKLEHNSNKKWWTKKNVVLRTIIPEESTPISKIEWYEGYNNEPIKSINGEILADNGKTLKVTTDSVLQQNYTAKLTYEDGNILKARVRVYIDKINPNFYGSDAKKINDEWKAGELNNDYIDYNIKAYDNESGLYGYAEIDKPDINCPSDIESYTKSKKIVLKNNGKRKICLIDNVGNKNEKTITVNHIDNTPMNCNFSVDGTIGGKDNNNLQWYTSSITINLNPEKIGLSGVTLTMVDEQGKKYYKEMQYNENQEINEPFETNVIDGNRKVTVNGTIKNQAGTSGTCSINVGVETSIKKPENTGSSSSYDSITVNYTSGEAFSGIASTKCYQINSNGTKTEGTLSGNNCVFKVTPTKQNSTYKFQKCITSKAGNSICSDVTSVQNIGYCTSGNYTTSMINKNYTNNCPACGVSSRTYTYNDKYTSKYNALDCGTSAQKTSSESCNASPYNKPTDCCSKTNYSYGSWSSCNKSCGGGNQNRTVTYTSAYDGRICPTGAPAVSSSSLSQSCNTMDCCSSLNAGNTYDITGCSGSCGYGTKTVRTPYYSSYDGRFCKNVDSNASCYLGPCGDTYYISNFVHQVNNSSAVSTSSKDITPYLHINNYSSISYNITIDSRNLWYYGTCGLSLIGYDPGDGGQYPLVVNGFGAPIYASSTITYSGTITECYKDVYGTEKMSLKNFKTFFVGDLVKVELRCQAGVNGDVGSHFTVNGTVTLNY